MIIDRREIRNKITSILAMLTASTVKSLLSVTQTPVLVTPEEVIETDSEQL
jgi:hypothetical protein